MLRTLFKCGGTDLPLPLMLMAKLLALYVLGHLVWIALPEPFLPFVLALDHLRHTPFSLVLKVTALLGAIAVLFNYRVRFACFLIGAAILLGVLSSRLYFLNGRLYLASLLILTGLYEPKTGPWLVRRSSRLGLFLCCSKQSIGSELAKWSIYGLLVQQTICSPLVPADFALA